MKVFAAPLQGYTEAPFRHYHAAIYDAADCYFSPFVRVEHGRPRAKDMRDAASPLNDNHPLVPQIIFRDEGEFRMLCDALIAAGSREIDLNMGCPFPPQLHKGRGAAFILNTGGLAEIAGLIRDTYSPAGISFSVKMRLGLNDAGQWKEAIGILNDIPLRHITVHPRTASQQYAGELHTDSFGEILSQCVHPVIFNGDILSPEHIINIRQQFPATAGIMLGRGLLARPSLISEYRSGEEWPEERRLNSLLRLHDGICEYYRNTLCGEAQILSKIKPFWDFPSQYLDRKAAKAIRKSTSLSSYLSTVAALRRKA